MAAPANIALFGWPQNIETAYAISTARRAASTQNASGAGSGDHSYLLTARDAVGKRLVHDFVRAGNSGAGAFYAVYKRPVFDRPARIALQFLTVGRADIARRSR
jgi:hypothetical protein